jgi:hypothetical protein
MGIEKLIQIAAVLVVLAVSTGKLPEILQTVRMAQIRLIEDSRASNWGHAMLLSPAK